MELKDAVEASHPQERAAATGHDRLGEMLAAARLAAGRDLEDIARETRVPLRHLRAIEADAHDGLPAMPYTVGFVKSFARAVGVDGDLAAARFRAETSKTAHVPMTTVMEPLDERRLPSRGVVMFSVLLLVLVLGALTAYGSGWFDHSTQVATSSSQVATVAEPELAGNDAVTEAGPSAPETPVATPQSPTPTAVAAPSPVAVTAGAASGVSITAGEDAWVRITAISPATGGIVSVKTGILRKGERFDLPTSPAGQRLWTGRAGALHVTVNGRAIPPLGGPVETIKNVSLTPSDLLARATQPAVAATGAR